MVLSKLLSFALLLTPTVVQTVAGSSVTFNNKQRFLFDTNGNQIDAYGAPLQSFDGTYYLYGNSFSTTGTAEGINAYTSSDLVNWQDHGNILTSDATATCFTSSGGCGRPHMLYNNATQKYVLWLNGNSPGYYTATSDSPTGPFSLNSQRALIDPQFDSLQPADFAVETHGKDAFIVFSALNFRDPRAGSIWPPIFQTIHVSKLTDDYLNTTGVSYPVRSSEFDLIDQETESPDIFWRNGLVYVSASNTCGYCNGSIGLVYRSSSYQGPWTRQIISGYSCGGQVEGVALLTDPSSGAKEYVWHSTHVPGGSRVGFSGHIFQPLQFNSDGSVQDLDCSDDATFPVNFVPGNSPAASGPATTAVDGTPADAAYKVVCNTDKFDLYQTWTASQSGSLSSVSVNVARGAQVNPLAITVFTNFTSYAELVAPEFQWQALGTGTFSADNMTYVFDTVTVDISPPVSVTKGQLLGFSFTNGNSLLSTTYNFSPYCHMETKDMGENSGYKLFQRGGGQNSYRGLSGTDSIVYERTGKTIKFFANYE